MRAERISKQIRFCRNSIDKLHKAYRICVSEKCEEQHISNLDEERLHLFSDLFALNISYCLQPCLDALFSLRDYILTFLFEEMYGKSVKLSRAAKFLGEDDKYDISTLINSAISQVEHYGIIAKTATYRNAFFHYTGSSARPLAEVYCLTFAETALGSIPRVIYPLDDDFERVRSIERGKFAGYQSKAQHTAEAKRFLTSGNYVDALDLVFDCMCMLMKISSHMEKCLPVESQIMKIAEKDILEADITRGGVRRKYKRNAAGKLEEVKIGDND